MSLGNLKGGVIDDNAIQSLKMHLLYDAHKSLQIMNLRRFHQGRFRISWVQNPQFLLVGWLSIYPSAPGRFVMLPKR
jgi:hypothetical protein